MIFYRYFFLINRIFLFSKKYPEEKICSICGLLFFSSYTLFGPRTIVNLRHKTCIVHEILENEYRLVFTQSFKISQDWLGCFIVLSAKYNMFNNECRNVINIIPRSIHTYFFRYSADFSIINFVKFISFKTIFPHFVTIN